IGAAVFLGSEHHLAARTGVATHRPQRHLRVQSPPHRFGAVVEGRPTRRAPPHPRTPTAPALQPHRPLERRRQPPPQSTAPPPGHRSPPLPGAPPAPPRRCPAGQPRVITAVSSPPSPGTSRQNGSSPPPDGSRSRVTPRPSTT